MFGTPNMPPAAPFFAARRRMIAVTPISSPMMMSGGVGPPSHEMPAPRRAGRLALDADVGALGSETAEQRGVVLREDDVRELAVRVEDVGLPGRRVERERLDLAVLRGAKEVRIAVVNLHGDVLGR